jgi:hypothetical protein
VIAADELQNTDVIDEAERVVAGATPDVTRTEESGGRSDPPAHLVGAAAALSGFAASWLAGSLIRGAFHARLLAAVGVLIGAGLITLGQRLTRPALAQYAVLPAAMIAGAAFVAPYAEGGTANLAGLIGEALDSGGLSAAPIAFDPGWRFILVVLFAVVSAAAAAIAVATQRAKLAVVVPLPLTMGAALLQPDGSELIGSTVAIFLVIGALAIAYGADLVADGGSLGGGFETRRLARGVAMLSALMVLMFLLSQTDFLFPETQRDRVIPPQKPPSGEIEKDREIFVVKGDRVGPWRMGVLDVYDGTAWLLPPYDVSRIVGVDEGERLPDASPTASEEIVEFVVTDLRGRQLPTPGGLLSVDGAGSLEYDPRTGIVGLERRVPQGLEYSASVAPTPKSADLNAAPDAPAEILEDFTDAPPAPPAVQAILAEAPEARFDRIQFIRDRLYRSVVAAGAGKPTDIEPARVAELFEQGAEATPYEITAAEAILVRWAGQPARIGFGYYRGEKIDDGFSLRPKHGSVWLEVYFEGHGWVPLVGVPPQAKSSLSAEQSNDDPRVQPSDELALTVYVPVQEDSFKLLFEIIRYWLLVASPFILALLILYVGYPALFKAVRRAKRERWGRAHGPIGRALAAYAEMRDRCFDMNLGDVRHTPLEFVANFEYDAEHDEIAWLVTRMFWGDLRRDLRDDDAGDAEAMCLSVQKRITSAQSFLTRVLGAVSRVSLRDPYNEQVPNFWPRLRVRERVTAPIRWVVTHAPRPRIRARRPIPSGVAVVLIALLLGGCVRQGGFDGAEVPSEYPERVAPDPSESIQGLTFVRESVAEEEYDDPKGRPLVTEGRVYTLHDATQVQGSLQVALFKPELDSSDLAVQTKIERGLGGGFNNYRIGTVKLRRRELPEQILYLWFPPERNVMVLYTMRRKYAEADEFVTAAIAHQRGLDADLLLAGGAK